MFGGLIFILSAIPATICDFALVLHGQGFLVVVVKVTTNQKIFVFYLIILRMCVLWMRYFGDVCVFLFCSGADTCFVVAEKVTADRHVTHVYRSNFHSGYDPGIHLGFCVAVFNFATGESAKL